MRLLRTVRCLWGRPEPTGRGQALVEFALIVPVFLMLLFALVDFGRVVFAQQAITQGAREGARAALVTALDPAITTSACPGTSTYCKIRTAAKAQAAGVALTDANITGATTCPSGLTDSTGTCFYPNGVTCNDPANPPPIVVKIQVTVQLLTPTLSNVMGGSFTPTATSTTYLPC
ncbi:MAG: pilus assembly protein [Chloroflexi bacterium]|nr:pilus assembly protein [Chloroflexota bacterium]